MRFSKRTGEESSGSPAVSRVFRKNGEKLSLLKSGPVCLARDKKQEEENIDRRKPEDEDAGGGHGFTDIERMPHIRVQPGIHRLPRLHHDAEGAPPRGHSQQRDEVPGEDEDHGKEIPAEQTVIMEPDKGLDRGIISVLRGDIPQQFHAMVYDERQDRAEEGIDRLHKPLREQERFSAQEVGREKKENGRGDEQAVRLRGNVKGTPSPNKIKEMKGQKRREKQNAGYASAYVPAYD